MNNLFNSRNAFIINFYFEFLVKVLKLSILRWDLKRRFEKINIAAKKRQPVLNINLFWKDEINKFITNAQEVWISQKTFAMCCYSCTNIYNLTFSSFFNRWEIPPEFFNFHNIVIFVKILPISPKAVL